jgi:hypothetical protein
MSSLLPRYVRSQYFWEFIATDVVHLLQIAMYQFKFSLAQVDPQSKKSTKPNSNSAWWPSECVESTRYSVSSSAKRV